MAFSMSRSCGFTRLCMRRGAFSHWSSKFTSHRVYIKSFNSIFISMEKLKKLASIQWLDDEGHPWGILNLKVEKVIPAKPLNEYVEWEEVHDFTATGLRWLWVSTNSWLNSVKVACETTNIHMCLVHYTDDFVVLDIGVLLLVYEVYGESALQTSTFWPYFWCFIKVSEYGLIPKNR